MADIGAEDRVEPGAERVGTAVERPDIRRVVGLAAEIERRDEQVAPVLLSGDLAGGVVVKIGDPAGQLVIARIGPAVALAQGRNECLAAVLAGEIRQYGAVEVTRIDIFKTLEAALLPMGQEIAIEHAGPARAAFEERDVEAREAAGHTAQEHRLAGGVVGGREMADMVVGEIRRRGAQTGAPVAAVEGRRDPKLQAFRPDRVVVVFTVEPDDVVPNRETGGLAFHLAAGL